MNAAALPIHPDAERVSRLAKWRREFHHRPELSWLEYRTTARVAEYLESLGFEIRAGRELYAEPPHNWPEQEIREHAWHMAANELGDDHRWLKRCRDGHSGLVASLDSGRPGPCHGFRFDLDALPIRESGDPDHLPTGMGFASERDGVMHACGHDGHTAVGIGLAEWLVANQAPDKWSGKVHLFFQPAEEVAGGGRWFAELPELAEVDRLLSFHLGITGRREIVLDATWLAARIVDVEISGRSSHAGNAPEQGNNALLAACTAIQGLYALPRHSGGSSRVGVGRLASDNAQNVISDHARFRFEVRGSHDAVCDELLERACACIKGAAAMQGCRAELVEVSRFEAQENHPELIGALRAGLAGIGVPETAVRLSHRVPASEDATSLSRVVQEKGGRATHLLFGCDTRGGHHNPKFDFDEDLLAWAV
ncbi:MAG: amidohydrolase, partial [Wenzhouxiangellaceae bacterium]